MRTPPPTEAQHPGSVFRRRRIPPVRPISDRYSTEPGTRLCDVSQKRSIGDSMRQHDPAGEPARHDSTNSQNRRVVESVWRIRGWSRWGADAANRGRATRRSVRCRRSPCRRGGKVRKYHTAGSCSAVRRVPSRCYDRTRQTWKAGTCRDRPTIHRPGRAESASPLQADPGAAEQLDALRPPVTRCSPRRSASDQVHPIRKGVPGTIQAGAPAAGRAHRHEMKRSGPLTIVDLADGL